MQNLKFAGAILRRVRGPRSPFKSLAPVVPQMQLYPAVFVLVPSLCLALSDADVKFDFVLMTSQYLRTVEL